MAAHRSGGLSNPERMRLALGGTCLVLTLAAAGCAGTVDAGGQELLSEELVVTPTPTSSPAVENDPEVVDEDRPVDDTAADDDVTAMSAVEPLSGTRPDQHSEVGQLVEGFPEDLLPLPPDAVVLVTSAVPVGDADVQEVSLNLRTTASAAQILELYRTALLGAGFTEVPPTTTQTTLAAEAVFTRSGGDELISVGVLDVDGARTLTVGGRVRTDV